MKTAEFDVSRYLCLHYTVPLFKYSQKGAAALFMLRFEICDVIRITFQFLQGLSIVIC